MTHLITCADRKRLSPALLGPPVPCGAGVWYVRWSCPDACRAGSVRRLQRRWLLARGRQAEGKRALARLAPAAEADLVHEAAALAGQAQREQAAQSSAWQALCSPALRSQLCLGSAAGDICLLCTASW